MSRKEAYLGIGAIIVIAACALLLYERPAKQLAIIEEVPPMTALMRQVLEKSTGFQLLVSYTDRGFEPAFASIRQGDAVRFTNNSSRELWVSAAAVHRGEMYPRAADSCGQSAFDSCVALQPKEFWEFTFEDAGVWGYANIANPAHEAALEVVVR
jgi:plastocyanin